MAKILLVDDDRRTLSEVTEILQVPSSAMLERARRKSGLPSEARAPSAYKIVPIIELH